MLGIIYIDNRLKSGVFTERHLAMLSAFANQAAVAIQNARLYDNLRGSLEERFAATGRTAHAGKRSGSPLKKPVA